MHETCHVIGLINDPLMSDNVPRMKPGTFRSMDKALPLSYLSYIANSPPTCIKVYFKREFSCTTGRNRKVDNDLIN